MSLNDDTRFDFNPNLLPYGGFEVSTLLAKLKTKNNNCEKSEEILDFLPPVSEISSGWLRSKMMTG
jgi:hypothetical protein